MKTNFILAALLLFVFSGKIFAQDCPQYYPITMGSSWETQSFDAKDKITGTTKSKVLTYTTSATGYNMSIETESSDDKGKNTVKMVYAMKCENGIFYIDMKNFLDPTVSEQYKDMQVSYDVTDMEMPSSLTVGTTLKDASLKMTISNQGMTLMTITVFTTNRKIESKETITVPAGTFEAYKLTYDTETKMMFKVKTHTVEYWVPGKGIIRSEQYNDKDKLQGYSVMKSMS
ncbi:MAG: hypothetical protein A2W91_05275 [Bacteroidetes bacterium GWF2_38_335]|nr:MAG: hypothetical protein A2W91_05275 [Bacteroidetes bacterium GWF2_38_335]OFY79759.1 MAG: hypothetical protein A2281_10145 [Bacteroidetes bacterium RIFOXYA12_FULL_38_20]HBS88146.1 hypothetical protein [Bacteroidales bacterium]